MVKSEVIGHKHKEGESWKRKTAGKSFSVGVTPTALLILSLAGTASW